MINSSILAFGLIFAAEMGDKSQLVCMTLAARHRARHVFLGAIAAFALLNLLAVTLGATLAVLIPEFWVTLVAATLFTWFGIQSLRSEEDDEDCGDTQTGRSIFMSTLMLIFIAELGDKTQIAVATLAATDNMLGVWLGGTLALIATSALGVFAGKHLLGKLKVHWVQRFSGALFLLLGLVGFATLL